MAGGSGFIRQALCHYFGKNNTIIVPGRLLKDAIAEIIAKTNRKKYTLW